MNSDGFFSSPSSFGVGIAGVTSPFANTSNESLVSNSSHAIVSEDVASDLEQIKSTMLDHAGLNQDGLEELTEHDHTLVELFSGLLVDWDNRQNPDIETFQNVFQSIVSALREGFNPENHFSAAPVDWSS